MTLGDDIAARIIESGARAPSGDNLQPWAVERSGHVIRISVDRSRDRSLYNFQYRASLIALGAMAENMVITAREHGLDARVTVADSSDGLPAVELTVEPAAESGHPLYASIARRCTNRRLYDRRPLERAVLTSLAAALPDDGRSELRFIEDVEERRVLARAAALNDRLLFEWRELHDVFYESVRWTAAEAERTRDGLFVKTLELGPTGPGFKAMRRWPVAAIAARLGSSRMAPFHSYRTFLSSGAFGFLRMDDHAPSDFVEGGRRLQRVWLTATSLGVAFQPMAGMLYLVERSRRVDGGGGGQSHGALIERAQAMFEQVLGAARETAPIMLFRIGRAAAPSATSLRRRPEARAGGEHD